MNIEFYKPAEKKIISWKSIIIPCILFFCIISFFLFEGMVRKLMMDATTEAYKVEINKVHTGIRGKGMAYKPTYYYIVDGEEYQYTPAISDSTSLSEKKVPILYYDSSNPNNAVAKYETKLHYGDYFVIIFICIICVIVKKTIIIR